MLPLSIQNNLNTLKKSVLVTDIECCSFYPGTDREINIRTSFDEYVQHAKLKWFGAYSYKYDKYYLLNARYESSEIKKLLQEHNIIVGFNNEEFDFPIVVNNGLSAERVRYNQVDMMQILGTTAGRNSKGYTFKNRGALMDFKFKNNSLRCMAETMGLTTKKGDIDYKIFFKDEWTPEEVTEIKTYLSSDIMATKEMFDLVWAYWIPFAELLDEKNVYDLSWIKSSIASLTYKAACRVMNTEPTYAENSHTTEDMGGRVIEPKKEEAEGCWYIDVGSLYPHILTMFNLPAELPPLTPEQMEATKQWIKQPWHGNDIFQVKGYYDIKEPHSISKYIGDKLKERIELKKTDPKNPMIYTLKILLNGLYGCFKSPTFEKIHTKNGGWDTCWLGQQIQQLMEEMLDQFGFDTIYGDTDSLFLKNRNPENDTKEYLQQCLKEIVDVIMDNVPFPAKTFSINIEHRLEYIMFPFSYEPVIDPETGENKKIKNRLVKERKGRKKNYLYIYEEDGERKVKLVGLPIIKDNATELGMKIYKEVLEKRIIELQRSKFSKQYIDDVIKEYLKRQEIMTLISQEYKVQPFATYKKEGQIQAQISKGYLDELGGTIRLIKNNKIGKAGKEQKYCTVEEAISANLSIDDLDLEKVYNELEPFIEFQMDEVTEELLAKGKDVINDFDESQGIEVAPVTKKKRGRKPKAEALDKTV